MSLTPPTPGQPGFQDWRDLADAVDTAGVLGAGLAELVANPHGPSTPEPPLHELESRARWHLAIGYVDPDQEPEAVADEFNDGHDGLCFDCGQLHELCECHVGDDCGRWINGRLTSSCRKAGSEECDFECPYRNTLRLS